MVRLTKDQLNDKIFIINKAIELASICGFDHIIKAEARLVEEDESAMYKKYKNKSLVSKVRDFFIRYKESDDKKKVKIWYVDLYISGDYDDENFEKFYLKAGVEGIRDFHKDGYSWSINLNESLDVK